MKVNAANNKEKTRRKKREKRKINELSNVIQKNSHSSTEESITQVKELLSSRIWFHRDLGC
jgi:hypothetical protein